MAAVFFVVGAANGTWVSRIPAVQQKLSLGTGALGLALLFGTLGLLVAMPLAGWVAHRRGSRALNMAGAVFLCLSLPLPALANRWWQLGAALFAFGVGMGVLEVAMNAQAVCVEQRYGRTIMSSLHGLFSTGGMAGAALGGLAAARHVAPLPHFLTAAAVLLLVGLAAGPALLRDEAAPAESGEPAFGRPMRALLALGLVAFCAMLAEGAMADWTALYMNRSLKTSEAVAALGFSVFSFSMAGLRFLGDIATRRVGPVRLIRLGGSCAAAGIALALVVHQPWAALVGFAMAGIGLATIVPVVYSAAGNTPGVASGPAIASVATTACTAYLAGPPLIGFAAEVITLRYALGALVFLCAAAALLAPAVASHPEHR